MGRGEVETFIGTKGHLTDWHTDFQVRRMDKRFLLNAVNELLYILIKLVLRTGKFHRSVIRPEKMDSETRDSQASYKRHNAALQVIT